MDWSKVWEEVKSWFVSESKELETELMPFIKQFASTIGQATLTAAEKAVTIFATQELTGAAKQTGAYNAIVDDLKAQSLTASTSLINSAIETVVAKLKTS
jgi:hypothetical protein